MQNRVEAESICLNPPLHELAAKSELNYHIHLSLDIKMEVIHFALRSIEWNKKRQIVIVCSQKDKDAYVGLLNSLGLVAKVKHESRWVWLKGADLASAPSISFAHCPSGNEEALAGYCLNNLRFIASGDYLTAKALLVLKAGLTNKDNSLVTFGERNPDPKITEHWIKAIGAESKSLIDKLEALIGILRKGKYEFADEKVCQEYLEEHFTNLGLRFEREYRLSDGRSIIDFFFPNSGIGLEVKASKAWNKMGVYRQCERYCLNPEVTGLILATAKPQGLPEQIEGKPTRFYYLGENGL
ncbi:hypothetical protein QRL11_004556 [Vibrio parahaemolyticus]|nr:hypothetical protein [Vibrio parahaemolyticus]